MAFYFHWNEPYLGKNAINSPTIIQNTQGHHDRRLSIFQLMFNDRGIWLYYFYHSPLYRQYSIDTNLGSDVIDLKIFSPFRLQM